MKIAIICEVLGKANNGTTIAALNLIDALKSKGHDVRVVCPDEDKRGLPGYYILPKAKFVNWIFRKNNLNLAKFDEKVVYEAVHDADVAHFMIALFISRKASKYVHSLGIPITGGFHAQSQNFASQVGMLHNKAFNKWAYHWYDNNVFCRAQAIHYPTQFIRDVFENAVGRKTNGYVISNGVNDIFIHNPGEKPDEFKDRYCILFTGRLAKEKSHFTLLKAVKKSKYASRIQLIFAGDGPLYPQITKWAAANLPIQPVIEFFKRDELVRIINYCDLYCHPSEAEIEGIACLEAISCGLVPLIADSPDCATREFALDEHSLFKVNDSDDLARHIDWFIEHPEEKEKMSTRYQEESLRFNQTQCMEKMEQMFLNEIKAR